MNIYYVADSKEKKRILVEFRKRETAEAYAKLLNIKQKGRFLSGDFVNHKLFGKDLPGEWPWVSQSNHRDYLGTI